MIRVVSLVGAISELVSRCGLRKFGVPPGGAWDIESEMILRGLGCERLWEAATTAAEGAVFLTLEASEDGDVSFMGMDAIVVHQGSSLEAPCRIAVQKGDAIQVAAGSRGMRLVFGASHVRSRSVRFQPLPPRDGPLQYTGGTENLRAEVTMHQDRVGMRLTGSFAPPAALAWSEPSVLGAIQEVKGALLVHGPDGPTTGGYPKKGVVAWTSLSPLCQLRPGSAIELVPVSIEEAVCRREQRRNQVQSWIRRVRVGLSVE